MWRLSWNWTRKTTCRLAGNSWGPCAEELSLWWMVIVAKPIRTVYFWLGCQVSNERIWIPYGKIKQNHERDEEQSWFWSSLTLAWLFHCSPHISRVDSALCTSLLKKVWESLFFSPMEGFWAQVCRQNKAWFLECLRSWVTIQLQTDLTQPHYAFYFDSTCLFCSLPVFFWDLATTSSLISWRHLRFCFHFTHST